MSEVYQQLSLFAQKQCTKCGEWKPLEAFAKHRNECRACISLYNHAYRGAHGDTMREQDRSRYAARDEETRARDRINGLARYHKNSQRIKTITKRSPEKRHEDYMRNKEAHKERHRAWKIAHPKARTEYHARRKARKRGATIGIADYRAIWERDHGICHICGLAVERADLHYDHVIPLAKGGAHSQENICVSHSWCNMAKSDKVPYGQKEMHSDDKKDHDT